MCFQVMSIISACKIINGRCQRLWWPVVKLIASYNLQSFKNILGREVGLNNNWWHSIPMFFFFLIKLNLSLNFLNIICISFNNDIFYLISAWIQTLKKLCTHSFSKPMKSGVLSLFFIGRCSTHFRNWFKIKYR